MALYLKSLLKSFFSRCALLLAFPVFVGGLFFGIANSYAFISLLDDDRKKISANKTALNTPQNIKSMSAQELQQNESWRPFLEQNGNEWKVLWDTRTNALFRVTNSNNITGKSLRKITDQSDLVEESQKFLQENESILKIPYQDFHLDTINKRGDVWYVRFRQYNNTVPVYGGGLTLRYNESGILFLFGGNIYPGITIDPRYEVNEEEAVGIAAKHLGISPDSLIRDKLQLVIYPQLNEENQTLSYDLCWELNLNSRQQAKGWKYFIEAHQGTIIENYDRARYLVSGKIRGQILPKYYDDYAINAPFPNLNISLLNKQSPLMYKDLNTNPDWTGSTSSYGWEYGQPNPGNYGMGGPDPDGGRTGDNIYGYFLNGNYRNNMTDPEYLMTPAIDCSSGQNIVLRFWRWLGVEGSDSDGASVDICSNLLGNWNKIWSNPEAPIYDGEWKLVFYDLSSMGDGKDSVFIRWGMGATNSSYTYCGWNIDDIGIYNSARGVTDNNGNFSLPDEAANNILDINLNGRYFQVKNGTGEGLVYTRNNVYPNTTNINVTLTPTDNYDPQTDTGIINTSNDIDELNAYYHANYLLEYVQNIDNTFLEQYASFFPIEITVHNITENNNSYWLQGSGIFFGEGDGVDYRNFAQFSDIIYHEVGHAITDTIYQSQPSSNPNRFTAFDALHEAFSDYWAGTINNDSEIAEGGFWIDHGGIRNLDNDLHYRLNYGDELYESSLILSGAMWDLRQALRSIHGDNGIKIADTLFLYAMYAESTSYVDFLLDVIAVDEAKFSGQNKNLITESFGLKGIAEPPTTPTSIMVIANNANVQLSWAKIPEAKGYNLYYEVSVIRALQSTSRYSTDGSGSDGGSDGGSMDDNDGGGGDNGDKDNDNSGGGSSGDNNTTNNYDNKIDLGDTTSYELINLQNNSEYKMVLTSYNEYGAESAPSQLIYATPLDPSTQTQSQPDVINYYQTPPAKAKVGCFISLISSVFGEH